MKKRYIRVIALLGVIVGAIGCGSITDTLKKDKSQDTKIGVRAAQTKQEGKKKKQESLYHYQEINDTINNRKGYLVEGEIDKESGETIMTMDLESITVVAKSRNIPERAGKVSLDFIVTVPERLISNKWQLKLTPVLFKASGEKTEFERLLLSGADFLKVQKEGYKKYQEFVNSIIPDSLFLQEMIDRKGYKRAIADLEDSIYQVWKKDRNSQLRIEKRNVRSEFFNGKLKKNQLRLKGDGIASILPQFWLYRNVDSIKIAEEYKRFKGKKNIVRRRITPEDSLAILKKYYRYKKIEENNWKKSMLENKFQEYVRFPYEKARLDTVIKVGNAFQYYYTQDVFADENTSKMKLTIDGMVLAKDESTYQVPESDTITYYVSSMIQFLDRDPRYVFEIKERRAEANLTSFIHYKSGKTAIDEKLENNAAELEKIRSTIKSLTDTGEFLIDSINMIATSSPEGPAQMNNYLSMLRAKDLKRYLAKTLDDKEGIDTLLSAKWIGEDWTRLRELVMTSNSLKNREGILSIIGGKQQLDVKEGMIRSKYPQDYKILREEFYPKLRAVNFTFNLHRKGMIKDTIHTQVIDTVYENGRSLLEKRKYKEALAILSDYNDYNTAVCLMSLGYDERALAVLERQKDTANRNYLMAILYSRLKNDRKAVEYYQRSCEQDESKEYRGSLDPEINRLIKEYNLNQSLY